MSLCLIKVTRTDDYLFDLDGIDGRTPEQIVAEFFKGYDLNRRHAARDVCHVGGSAVLVDVEIINRDLKWDDE